MRTLVPIVVLAALLSVACSSSNHTASPTKLPSANVAASQPSASQSAAAGTAAVSAQGAVGAGNAAVEDRLTKVSLQKADVPPELDLANRRPWTNKDYSTGQPDPVAYQQKLDGEGRITGVIVQFVAMATAQANAPEMAGLIDLLSTWKSDANASAGLADTLTAVTPQASQPNAVKTEKETVNLGSIGDEVTATHLRVTPLTPGVPVSDAYIVGLRKGKDTAVMIFTGQSGAPTLDTVKRLVSLQAQRLS